MQAAGAITYLSFLGTMSDGADTSLPGSDACLQEPVLSSLFFQNGPHAVFLHDYVRKGYAYISPNIQQATGYCAADFLEGGAPFLLHLLHPDDRRIFNEVVFADMLAFLARQPLSMHAHYRFSLNYRLRHPNGRYGCVQQQGVFLCSDAQGRPLCNFGTLTDISTHKVDTRLVLKVEKLGADSCSENVYTHTYFPAPAEEQLTKKELEVLKWMLEGLNSRQIADKMFTSYHTVKTHRGHMLQKTNTKNATGLIRYALLNGLLYV
jgi:DNA-binding CsgD family transcriptional regulator